MVSINALVFIVLSACISLGVPIALFLFLRKRYQARFLSTLVGAGVFLLFVLLLETLFATWLFSVPAAKDFLMSRSWLYALYGGLQAGLFEETGRLCAFLFLLRRAQNNNLGNALAYGVGHSGMEAVLVCTLPMIANLVYAVLLGRAGMEGLQVLTTNPLVLEQLKTVAETLQTTPPIHFLAAGLERLIAIAFHLAASVLVWMAASKRGPWGLFFLAILFHTVLNIPAGLYQFGVLTNIWMVELLTAVLAAGIVLATSQIYAKCAQTYTPLLPYSPNDLEI